jgi:hypothetical protein
VNYTSTLTKDKYKNHDKINVCYLSILVVLLVVPSVVIRRTNVLLNLVLPSAVVWFLLVPW